MSQKHIVPTHTFETEQNQPVSNVFMYIEWGGKRKITHTPHRHSFNELIFIYHGEGRHEIDFVDYPLQSYSVHFVKTAQVHLIDRSEDSMGYSLLFSDDFLYAIRQNIDLRALPFFQMQPYPIVQLDEVVFLQMKPILAQIQIESSYDSLSMELIRSYCQVLLLLISRAYQTLVQPTTLVQTTDKIVLQFAQLIEKHFTEHLSISQYAALLYLSPNYLSEVCKRETNKSAHQLLQDRILLEAKRLLCYSNLSIKEIAYQLNFDDASYFSRFFKKNTQISPAEYRQWTIIQ